MDAQNQFLFMGRPYSDHNSLMNAMGLNWLEGRRSLLTGEIQTYFGKTNKALAATAANAEKEYKENPTKADLILWKWLYGQGHISSLYWHGRDYGNWARVCATLNAGKDGDLKRLIESLLNEQLFSLYAKSLGKSPEVLSNVKFIERCYCKQDSGFHKRQAVYVLLYVMNEVRTFVFDGQLFHSVDAFADYLRRLAKGPKDNFTVKIRPLFYDAYNFDPHFEGWLLNLGGQKAIASWNAKFQDGFGAENEDDFVPEEIQDLKTAGEQKDEDFAKAISDFEEGFLKLLTSYPNEVYNQQQFLGLMNDFFPQKPLQVNLLVALYKMDIVKAIRDASEMNTIFMNRFIRRLVNDFGVRDSFAKWAVSIWCVCFGAKQLNKPCRVSIYMAMQ